LQEARKRAEEIFAALNKLPGIKITAPDGGTNIYHAVFGKEVDGAKMQSALNKEYGIRMIPPDDKNKTILMVNETLLYRDAAYIINAFTKSMIAV
jgi:threonine aldolase